MAFICSVHAKDLACCNALLDGLVVSIAIKRFCFMNIYARYFDREALVHSFEDLMDFLSSIPEIPVDDQLAEEVKAYLDSDMPYPRRYKIRPRVYFILIKTPAESMDEFKNKRKDDDDMDMHDASCLGGITGMPFNKKDIKASLLAEERVGWYYCTISFKRVIQIANTSKFRYQDTDFAAYTKASSGNECYAKILQHLKNRQEIDLRSQFPSAKGQNFTFEFVGDTLPTEDSEK